MQILHSGTRVEIEPGNWSRSGLGLGTRQKRHAGLVVFPTWRLVGNRSGYPTRNPSETSRWFGYAPDMKAGREPAVLLDPFLAVFWGVLSSIKISFNSQLDSSPLYSSSIFRTLLCFLARRIRFRSHICSSSSILIFKKRIRSTHKNEKWLKQMNSRCRNYRLYYYRYIFVLAQIVNWLFARNLNNNIIYIRIFWQILTEKSCIGPHTESYTSHL